ncbi:hypothetical protein AWENTII_000859 [Aspergillus wentii]
MAFRIARFKAKLKSLTKKIEELLTGSGSLDDKQRIAKMLSGFQTDVTQEPRSLPVSELSIDEIMDVLKLSRDPIPDQDRWTLDGI